MNRITHHLPPLGPDPERKKDDVQDDGLNGVPLPPPPPPPAPPLASGEMEGDVPEKPRGTSIMSMLVAGDPNLVVDGGAAGKVKAWLDDIRAFQATVDQSRCPPMDWDGMAHFYHWWRERGPSDALVDATFAKIVSYEAWLFTFASLLAEAERQRPSDRN